MTEIPYHRIAAQFYNRPLLLLPSSAETISAFLLARIDARARGQAATERGGESVQAFRPTAREDGSMEFHSPRASRFHGEVPASADGSGRPAPFRLTTNGVAIITLVGEFVNRGAWVGASSGLISYEGFKFQMQEAARDQRVRAILLDFESPGGEAVGCFEAAALVRAAAKVKPVISVVNGIAASAAYALASGATRVITIPTGISGSIGVVMLHLDFSKFLSEEGIKPTLIFAGAHKVDGNPFEPLPEDVRGEFQRAIDSFYAQFVATVAAGRRGLSEQAVRATEARVFKGEEAVSAGLADAVGTFEEVLAELSRNSSTARPASPTPSRLAGVRSALLGSTSFTRNFKKPPALSAAGNLKETKMELNEALKDVGSAAAAAPAKAETIAEIEAVYPTQISGIKTAAFTEGATAERARIAAIDAVPGAQAHGELVAGAKADGKSTAAELALRILEAEKTTRAKQLGSIKDVETETSKVKPAPTSAGAVDGQPKASTVEEWKAEYAASDKIKDEFATADDYAAFKKAEADGKVRILHGKSAA